MSNKGESKQDKQFVKILYKHFPLRKIISIDELAFLGLVRNLSSTRECFATNSYLAEILNVSERTIGRYIKNLVDLGLLIYEKNSKTKSNRILKVNETKIVEILEVRQDCPSSNSEKIDDKVDKSVYDDGQGCPIYIDSCCIENKENDCNLNENRNLIDNIIDNKIDNICSAYAEQTATQSNGATHLSKADIEIIDDMFKNTSFKEIGEKFKKDGMFKTTNVMLYKFERLANKNYNIFDQDNLEIIEVRKLIMKYIKVKVDEYEKYDELERIKKENEIWG